MLTLLTKSLDWLLLLRQFINLLTTNYYTSSSSRTTATILLLDTSHWLKCNTDRRSSEIQGTVLGKCLRAWSCMPACVAQSSHPFVGGTVSTWARWRIPVNKRQKKSIRNADQALIVCGAHADQIVGSPSWWSSINYNRSMPEDLKLSQISSSLLPLPFRDFTLQE